MRHPWIVVVLLALPGITYAAPKQVTNEFAVALQKAGYSNPTRVLDTPAVRVVTAVDKHGTRRVVFATPDGASFAMAAGDAVPANYTVTARESTLFPKLDGLVAVDVVFEQKRANDAFTRDGKTVVLRANAEIACVLPGANTVDPGTQCGSGGSTSVAYKIVSRTRPFKVLMTTTNSGHLSVRQPDGTCLARSPVRPRPISEVVDILATGTCKRSQPPAGAMDVEH